MPTTSRQPLPPRLTRTRSIARPLAFLSLTFGGPTSVEPILFSSFVLDEIGIPQGRQGTGGFLGGVSGWAGAIEDNLRAPVGQEVWRLLADAIGRAVA